nr:immunoglobulin light chain junction region [Macaca mulatta]MOW61940.1 immunoglobulin light chain junction region [Macaca mulatta]MOW62009.1 immunoglobulin light chain junction region [Macaca mulatta]MOW62029.1 immunoglobulin light chain junction region [Macaca mulatta]MOW62679.1 immunoglobulin light chain junction region [Macaca mulatta]
CGQGTHLTF